MVLAHQAIGAEYSTIGPAIPVLSKTNDNVERPTTTTTPAQIKPGKDTMDCTTKVTVNRDATAVDKLEPFMLPCGKFINV